MAIVLGEQTAAARMKALETENDVLISAGTVAEALIVSSLRHVDAEVASLIDGLGFEIASPLDPASAHRIRRLFCRRGCQGTCLPVALRWR